MPSSFFRRRAHLKKRVFPWKLNPLGSQDYSPAQNVTRRLGIKKGEHVLVFAGYYGEWASSLSDLARISFTDPSKEYSSLFSKRHAGARVKAVAGELVPTKYGKYDWSFSFEPFPLVQNGGLTYSMTRAMMNNKGAKIVLSNNNPQRNKHLVDIVQRVAKVYGAKVTGESVTLDVISAIDTLRKAQKSDSENLRFGDAQSRKEKMSVVTLLTNPSARKKAMLDLAVENLVDKEIKQKTKRNYSRNTSSFNPTARTTQKDFEFAKSLVPMISQRLNCPQKEIESSLARINQLAQLYAQKRVM